MNAILKYPGSKWALADWIISYFPEHHSYLEPFLGSGAVFFTKPRSDIETINDLDGDVANLFRWIRDDPERLAHAVYCTPYSRQVYEEAHSQKPEDSLQQALYFYIRLQMGYGVRTNEKNGWKNDIQGRERAYAAKDWCSLPQRLLEAAERLRGVQIEQRPAVELMKRFNYKDVLIYLDPPYLGETRKKAQYQKEMMSRREHEELLSAALEHKGPVLISGYASGLYEELLHGWRREERIAMCQSGEKRTEVLWMNFEGYRQISMQEVMNP